MQQNTSWSGLNNGVYWGLVRVIGPSAPTSEDDRRANSRAGGPHAGHGNWMQHWSKPWVQSLMPEKPFKYIDQGDVVTQFDIKMPAQATVVGARHGGPKGLLGKNARDIARYTNKVLANNNRAIQPTGISFPKAKRDPKGPSRTRYNIHKNLLQHVSRLENMQRIHEYTLQQLRQNGPMPDPNLSIDITDARVNRPASGSVPSVYNRDVNGDINMATSTGSSRRQTMY